MDETPGNQSSTAAPSPVRVIVIEDDQRLREYAIGALVGASEIAVVGEAATLAEGLELVDLQPDMVLLDLGLPDGSGIAVIEAVRARVPLCRILVFTVFEDRASVLGTLKAGADGYILKDTTAEMVLGHVRAVMAGETPISARAAGHLLTLVRDDPPPASPEQAKSVPHLSPRERECLMLAFNGLTARESSMQMTCTERTVNYHLANAMAKLRVENKLAAIQRACWIGAI